jgi:hypothetical protein
MSALLVPILAQALSVDVGARTEVGVRYWDGNLHHDNVTLGHAALRLKTERARWELVYSPSLIHLALGEPSMTRLVMQAGSLMGQLRLTPRTIAYFAESAAYGTQNFRMLAVTSSSLVGTEVPSNPSDPASPPQSNPQAQAASQAAGRDETVRYGALSTNGSLSHQFSRRTTGNVSAGYSVTGGADHQSQSRIPRLRQLEATGGIKYAIGQRDTVGLHVEATRITTSLRMNAYSAMLEAEWTRQLSAAAIASVSIGSGYWTWRRPDGEERQGLLPVGSASLTYRLPIRRGRLEVRVTEGVAPWMDRILGTINQRSLTDLSLAYGIGKFSARTSGYAIFTWGEMQRSSRAIYGTSETLGYAISKAIGAEIGSRQLVLEAADAGSSLVMWTVYCGVAVSSGALVLSR